MTIFKAVEGPAPAQLSRSSLSAGAPLHHSKLCPTILVSTPQFEYILTKAVANRTSNTSAKMVKAGMLECFQGPRSGPWTDAVVKPQQSSFSSVLHMLAPLYHWLPSYIKVFKPFASDRARIAGDVLANRYRLVHAVP